MRFFERLYFSEPGRRGDTLLLGRLLEHGGDVVPQIGRKTVECRYLGYGLRPLAGGETGEHVVELGECESALFVVAQSLYELIELETGRREQPGENESREALTGTARRTSESRLLSGRQADL